jgi:hypothetical protein
LLVLIRLKTKLALSRLLQHRICIVIRGLELKVGLQLRFFLVANEVATTKNTSKPLKTCFSSTKCVFLGYIPHHKRVKFLDAKTCEFISVETLSLMKMTFLLPLYIQTLVRDFAVISFFFCLQIVGRHALMIICLCILEQMLLLMARFLEHVVLAKYC